MSTLEVIKMGNPLLRSVCQPVTNDEIASQEFQAFIDSLILTMQEEDGAGIAAPQVGILKRLFVIEMDGNKRYPDEDNFPMTVIINPEIKILSNEITDSWEGCLSIPGIRGKLKRSKQVQLSGVDRHGEPFEKILDGFPAIVAQHELDHLNGILFIDRMKTMETLTFEEEYSKYWNV